VSCHIVVANVAVVATDLLVTTGTECVGPGTREDDGTDRDVVARPFERIGQLKQCLGAKGVASLGSIDCDARNPLAHLVDDVAVLAANFPVRKGPRAILLDWV
jgi:hypothetical protein